MSRFVILFIYMLSCKHYVVLMCFDAMKVLISR